MGTVTFLKPDMREPLTVEVRSQEKRTLLSLLTHLKLFSRRTCDRHCCGECAVKVAQRTFGAPAPPVLLTEQEKEVLYRAGKLSAEQYQARLIAASPSLWRLACLYVVRYEEIIVAI